MGRNMFDLGMGELVLLAVIALIVMGPEKFPEVARIAIRAFRDFRGYIDDVKREVANEIKPVKNELHQLVRHNPEEYLEKLTNVIGDTTAPAPDDPTLFPYPAEQDQDGDDEQDDPNAPDAVDPRYPPPAPPE